MIELRLKSPYPRISHNVSDQGGERLLSLAADITSWSRNVTRMAAPAEPGDRMISGHTDGSFTTKSNPSVPSHNREACRGSVVCAPVFGNAHRSGGAMNSIELLNKDEK